MKKLITAALILSAISVFAGASLTPAPYCDCRGVGLPTNTTSHVHVAATALPHQKTGNATLAHGIFYYVDWLWLVVL